MCKGSGITELSESLLQSLTCIQVNTSVCKHFISLLFCFTKLIFLRWFHLQLPIPVPSQLVPGTPFLFLWSAKASLSLGLSLQRCALIMWINLWAWVLSHLCILAFILQLHLSQINSLLDLIVCSKLDFVSGSNHLFGFRSLIFRFLYLFWIWL